MLPVPPTKGQRINEDAEGAVAVTCYHKFANLLRAGDVIPVGGWLLRRGNERRLIQILPAPDRILWWEVAPAAEQEPEEDTA